MTFTGNVNLATLTTFAGAYSISMHGGATITNATTFNNTGAGSFVTLNNNGIYNFNGGLTATAPANFNLGGTINTTNNIISLGLQSLYLLTV